MPIIVSIAQAAYACAYANVFAYITNDWGTRVRQFSKSAAAAVTVSLMLLAPAAFAEGFVEKYERMLFEMGLDVGKIDDILDGKAQEAVRVFQVSNGIYGDGRLNAETQARIEQVHASLPEGQRRKAMYADAASQPADAHTSTGFTPLDATTAQPSGAETIADDEAAVMGADAPADIGEMSAATEAQHHWMRLGLSFNADWRVIDSSNYEVEALLFRPQFDATVQFPFGLYGSVGLASVSLEELEINQLEQSTASNHESWVQAGLGWRFAMNRARGLYWGFAVESMFLDEKSYPLAANTALYEDLLRVGIFAEKDRAGRYGRIQLALQMEDNATLGRLDGTHIWFLAGGPFGLGLNWGLGAGETDYNEDLFEASFGAQLMLRF